VARLSEQGGEENTNQNVLSPSVTGEILKQPHYQQILDATGFDDSIVSSLFSGRSPEQHGKPVGEFVT
jgi:hypothetical protein